MLVNIKPWMLKNGEKLFSRMKINPIQILQMAFRSTGTQNIFQKWITQQGIGEEDLL